MWDTIADLYIYCVNELMNKYIDKVYQWQFILVYIFNINMGSYA